MKFRYICGFAIIWAVLFSDVSGFCSGAVRDLCHKHIITGLCGLSHRTPYVTKGVPRPMSRIIPVRNAKKCHRQSRGKIK
jgi:hypothetical protein